MAGQRKLQQEMDRVFKKIAEGLESFDNLYERHEDSPTATQKDKLESDLKKEIKKLQRFREQVKGWQTANDIKDKAKLLEYRRSVEQAMEKYKVIEKESKTKAYSDQSLATVEVPEVDNEAMEFVRNSLDEIERQEEKLEAEVEKITSTKKGKRISFANEERKHDIEDTLENHRWHTKKLELILRLLENEVLQVDDVLNIQEDIKYYLEENQDPDFINDDTIYDDLNLEADEAIAQEVHGSLNHSTKDDDIVNGSSLPPSSPQKIKRKESSSLSPVVKTSSNVVSSYPNASGSPSSNDSSISTPVASYSTTGGSIPTMTTLKPAPVPAKPTELKWAAAVTAAVTAGGQGGNSASHSPVSTKSQLSSNSNARNAASVLEALKKQKPQEGSPEKSPVILRASPGATNVNITTSNNYSPSPEVISRTETVKDKTDLNHIQLKGEIEAERDPDFRFLPPGIQATILSFAITRSAPDVVAKLSLSNTSTMVTIPRSFSPLKASVFPPGLEAQRVSTIWSLIRGSPTLETDAKNIDSITLFYAYYYALSEYERQIAAGVLASRQWKCSSSKTIWFQRSSIVKMSGEGFELADYNVFDASKWSLAEKKNYRLDLSQIIAISDVTSL